MVKESPSPLTYKVNQLVPKDHPHQDHMCQLESRVEPVTIVEHRDTWPRTVELLGHPADQTSLAISAVYQAT